MRLILCSALAFSPVMGFGQIIKVRTDSPPVAELFTDSVYGPCIEGDCNLVLEQITKTLQNNGYLLASLTERLVQDTLIVSIKEGPRYTYGQLDFSLLPRPFQGQNILENEQVLSPRSLDSLYNVVLDYSERNGYPLATIGLDSIRFIGTEINARVLYDPGPLTKFNSVSDKENKFKSSWLLKLAKINKGDLYNQALVDRLPEQLKSLGITVSSIQTTFDGPLANILIETESEVYSNFDGIIGLQQNEKTGKSTVAGYLDLSLANLFRSGKLLDFHWERLRPSTQELNIGYVHPSVVRSVDLGADFDLLRMDSSFLSRKASLSLIHPWKQQLTFSTFYQFQGSSLLARSGLQGQLDASDAILHSGGMGISGAIRKMDYSIRALVGSKRISANSTLRTDLFGGSTGNIIQWSLEYDISSIRSISQLWEIRFENRFGWVSSSELYQNDLFLLGGLSSIRGFNEQSLFTDRFISFQVEPHLLISKSSYLLMFWDTALLTLPPSDSPQWLNGWGMGIELESSQSGRFRFLVAWGKSENQVVDFSNPRIHIGFLSKF